MSSDVVPIEEFIPQKSWRDARKVRMEKLGEAMSSLVKLLKRVAESEFEISLGSVEI